MAQLLRYRAITPVALRHAAFNFLWKGMNQLPSEDALKAALELKLVCPEEEEVHIVLSKYFRRRVCNSGGHGFIMEGIVLPLVVEVKRNAPSDSWLKALDFVKEHVNCLKRSNLQASLHGVFLLFASSYLQICGFVYDLGRDVLETEAFTDMISLQRAPLVDCMGFGDEEQSFRIARLLGGILKYLNHYEQEASRGPLSVPYPLRRMQDVKLLSSAGGSFTFKYTDEHGVAQLVTFLPTHHGLEWPKEAAAGDEFIGGYWMRSLQAELTRT